MEVSKEIERFLTACEECVRQYNSNFNVVGLCNNKTSDFLHTLELNNLTASERSKLTTAEKKNLTVRRQAKNTIEQYEPLKKYIDTPDGKRMINMLKQVLGDIRKVESYHEKRCYRKRVIE